MAGRIVKITRLEGQPFKADDEAAIKSRLGTVTPVLDYGDLVVAPGLIDTHVHMDEPGREHWEGNVVWSFYKVSSTVSDWCQHPHGYRAPA